ncbi:sigma factor-like helix-turn-helix DNA-binding protein [Streptomyces sp. NPDC056503]|uniref:sigma factor-like helix-turn-helix DNA-binding protein n=1 Tax=Streptomyces sp. NPDC056503 TaxID=3345842 RepID=UPI00369C4BB5
MHDDAVVTALDAWFDADEERLRGVALRLLGAGAEREAGAVLARVRAGLGADAPATARAWSTALVARACLDGAGHAGVREGEEGTPEEAAVEGLDEAVLLGFLAVLGRLGARERVAYLLHDVFGLPPGETARVLGCSPADAARRARRARERLRGGNGGGGRDGSGDRGGGRRGDTGGRRALVDAFLAAARARDAAALARLLAPEAVAYTERGPVHGAAAVAAEAAAVLARPGGVVRPALVEGEAGLVVFAAGKPVAAVAFGFGRGRVVGLLVTTGEGPVRALDVVFPGT